MSNMPELIATSNVVEIGAFRAKRAKDVWQCQCGHQEFTLYANGDIQCAGCDEPHSSLCWGDRNKQ